MGGGGGHWPTRMSPLYTTILNTLTINRLRLPNPIPLTRNESVV